MKSRKTWVRLVAFMGALALVAAACGSSSEDTTTTTTTTVPPGTTDTTAGVTPTPSEEYCDGSLNQDLIWAHEQEPVDMHLDDPNNNLTITAHIREAIWEGAYGIDSATTYYPELLAEEVVVETAADGTVTYNHKIRDDAVWSDGTPVTSTDFETMLNVYLEGGADAYVYLLVSRQGYDIITSFNIINDKEFNYTTDGFFAGYKASFDQLMPAHIITDAATGNALLPQFLQADGTPMPSTGAMLFSEWNQGINMELVRNDAYHGSQSPDAKNTGIACVSGVTINFVPDTDAQVNALKAGESHIMWSQPQLQFEDLAGDPDFTNASPQGPTFEHWGMNLLNTHLAKPAVREALAYALDKPQVMELLYTPLFGDSLPSAGLGNTYWMANQPQYEDHQTKYNGALVDEAKANLEGAGYVLGSDGIYEHPTDGKLTLRVGTTGGNALRELQQQIIQAQMKTAGIEIVIDNVPGGAYFSEVPFSDEALAASNSGGAEGDPTIWDITQFAWVGGPWPGGQSPAYFTGDGNNPYGHNVAAFDDLANGCDAIVDDTDRDACYNTADKYVTTLEIDAETGLFMLPLTQKPTFFAVSNGALSAIGSSPDANNAGPLSHVQDYKRQ